jgi:DNA-binding NarL/FixJ family response regulator
MKTRKIKTAAPARKRIFILDDHPMTRRGLAQLIQSDPNLTVCGEAENAPQALAALKPPLPDLVLSDITLPGKSGLEFIKDIKAQHPKVAVLVMSMHDENAYAERVLRVGGDGYIMKSEGGDEVIGAIWQVLQGQTYVSKNMSALLASQFAGRRSQSGEMQTSLLTDREFEVYQLLGQGLSTRAIGEHLHISPKTVETHRMNIKEKFKLKTGPELIKHAVRWAAANQLI